MCLLHQFSWNEPSLECVHILVASTNLTVNSMASRLLNIHSEMLQVYGWLEMCYIGQPCLGEMVTGSSVQTLECCSWIRLPPLSPSLQLVINDRSNTFYLRDKDTSAVSVKSFAALMLRGSRYLSDRGRWIMQTFTLTFLLIYYQFIPMKNILA